MDKIIGTFCVQFIKVYVQVKYFRWWCVLSIFVLGLRDVVFFSFWCVKFSETKGTPEEYLTTIFVRSFVFFIFDCKRDI